MDQFWNPYSYVGGSPLTDFDPDGLIDILGTSTCLDAPGDALTTWSAQATGPGQISIESHTPSVIAPAPSGWTPASSPGNSIPTPSQEAIEPVALPGMGQVVGIGMAGVNYLAMQPLLWLGQKAGINPAFLAALPFGLKNQNRLDIAGKNAPRVRSNQSITRIDKMAPSESPIWKSLRGAGGKTRTVGQGKSQRYFEWDFTHGDIEVYDPKGRHLGSMNPTSGAMYKPPVPGRRIEL
jgi:hypothetical protein